MFFRQEAITQKYEVLPEGRVRHLDITTSYPSLKEALYPSGRHKVTKKRQHLGRAAPEDLRWHGQQLFLRPLLVVVKALHPYVVEEVIDIFPQHLYGIPLDNTDNTSIYRTFL